ncbi:MAG: hypothetical protein HRT47_03490 [Candidatus Caenarcaniphilales bacterium]|nr:hypothetical protein [Candidatus Caenarcaniphilales bacterium]
MLIRNEPNNNDDSNNKSLSEKLLDKLNISGLDKNKIESALLKLDRNENGKLDINELVILDIMSKSKEISKQFDLDGDSEISEDEKDLYKQIKTGLESIQEEEFTQLSESEKLSLAKKKFDKDQDGEFSNRELRNLYRIANGRNASYIFDLDGDRKVSEVEKNLYKKLKDNIISEKKETYSQLSEEEKLDLAKSKFDGNKDGQLSDRELNALNSVVNNGRYGAFLDLDGDLNVSEQEAEIYQQIRDSIIEEKKETYNQLTEEEKLDLAKSKFDRNKDGQLSDRELNALNSVVNNGRYGAFLDLDGDLNVSEQEAEIYQQIRDSIIEEKKETYNQLTEEEKLDLAKSKFDRNKDGQLTGRELSSLGRVVNSNRFNSEYDLDGDGLISSEERNLYVSTHESILDNYFKDTIESLFNTNNKAEIIQSLTLLDMQIDNNIEFMNKLTKTLEERSGERIESLADFLADKFGVIYSGEPRHLNASNLKFIEVKGLELYQPNNDDFAQILFGSDAELRFDYNYIDTLQTSPPEATRFSFGKAFNISSGDRLIDNFATVNSNVIETHQGSLESTIMNELAHKNLLDLFENPKYLNASFNFFRGDDETNTKYKWIDNNNQFNEFMSDVASITVDPKFKTMQMIKNAAFDVNRRGYEASHEYIEKTFNEQFPSIFNSDIGSPAETLFKEAKLWDNDEFETKFNEFIQDYDPGLNLNFNNFTEILKQAMTTDANDLMDHLRDNHSDKLNLITIQ